MRFSFLWCLDENSRCKYVCTCGAKHTDNTTSAHHTQQTSSSTAARIVVSHISSLSGIIICSYFSIAYVLDLLAFVVLHIYLLILRNSIIEIPQDFLIRIPTVDGEWRWKFLYTNEYEHILQGQILYMISTVRYICGFYYVYMSISKDIVYL